MSFPVPSVQLSASDFLYSIAVVTPVSFPSLLSALVQSTAATVAGASGVVFAFGAVSLMAAPAVGVPEMVICLKLSRVTEIPLTALTL